MKMTRLDKSSSKILKLIICVEVILSLNSCASPPLMKAVMSGDLNRVRTLLDQGEDVHQLYAEGATPFTKAAMQGNPDILVLMIKKGLDVNNICKGCVRAYSTPLRAAAYSGHAHIVKLLLDAGAVPDENASKIARDRGYTTVARIIEGAIELRYGMTKKKQTNVLSGKISIKSDVDFLPSVRSKPKKNAYAIVIGIEKYREKLPSVNFAASDAQLVSKYLTNVMGYPGENIVTLIGDKATRSDIKKYIETWLTNNVDKDASVLIYYSGHGAPDPTTGDAFIVPYDGDPTFIGDTGYSLDRLYKVLEKLPVKEVVVMLDSCFSGAGGRSVIAKGARPIVVKMKESAVASNKLAVLSASSGNQISSTYDKKGHGLFTYFMLKGLKGEGDANGDGRIEMNELFNYIKPKVTSIARKLYNNEQTPQMIIPKGRKIFLMEGLR